LKRHFFGNWGGLKRKRDRVHLRISDIARWLTQIEARQRNVEAILRSSGMELTALKAARQARLDTLSIPELTSSDRFDLEAFCRAQAQSTYLGDHTALCRILGRYKVYVDTRDTGFASNLLLDGFWEMWLTIFIARQVRAGMVAIDVGANFGYYTLILADLVGETGHVYAVEPNPVAATALRRSVDLNGAGGRTTVIEAAAGAADGSQLLLFTPHGEPKNAMIVASPDGVSAGSGTLYPVSEVAVDTIAAGCERIDFIKIDAEGAEEGIIAGALKTLTRDKPHLVLEFNAARYRNAAAFLGQITSIYGRLRHIDYYGNAVEIPETQIQTDRVGEDWLLYFGSAE
jgi:FkbM family methyltransferase